ncbi:macro domain-containing protein [Actinoplanes sp. NPDC048791]|uniref:macro domain-containing protein n=1 Tax=Actinoplanes sp. NPDC048791 TaxID=3154623 RepID=UPI0033C2D31E
MTNPESDLPASLRAFSARLKELHLAAGGPSVSSLHADPTFPLRRAHIYATLGGNISQPPSWKFVEAFLQRCARYARGRRIDLEMSTEPADWEPTYRRLTQLWEMHQREQHSADSFADRYGKARGQVLTVQDITHHVVRDDRRIGVVTGDIRQVRCANIWVNPESTEMEMARVHEFSISAIIRYAGATHDARGRVAEDLIANELTAKVAGHRPVEPGTVVMTGAGRLRELNGVHYVVHVASVHGEPGSGFHPMRDVGRCVTNVLQAVELLEMPVAILFPLLGTGNAGGDVGRIATSLVHEARNYLRAAPASRINTVYFLAYTDQERNACRRALKAADLRPEAS